MFISKKGLFVYKEIHIILVVRVAFFRTGQKRKGESFLLPADPSSRITSYASRFLENILQYAQARLHIFSQ